MDWGSNSNRLYEREVSIVRKAAAEREKERGVGGAAAHKCHVKQKLRAVVVAMHVKTKYE